MSEYIHGPVQKWEATDADKLDVERLLNSDDELMRAYGKAYDAGCFVKEFAGITGVGEMDSLALMAFRIGSDIDIDTLSLELVDLIALGAYPGIGETRTERVLDRLRQVLEAREVAPDPDSLVLFGSHTENGFTIKAYMLRSAQQATQWTVEVFREGEDSPFRTVAIPMMHESIFGIDDEDRVIFSDKVDRIMQELTA